METTIRVGKVPFYATDVFPYGLSRSSYFNKRESEDIVKYGDTLQKLQNGNLTPINEDELTFIHELNNEQVNYSYSVKLWKKYMAAVAKRSVFHGFSASNRTSSNDSVYDSFAEING